MSEKNKISGQDGEKSIDRRTLLSGIAAAGATTGLLGNVSKVAADPEKKEAEMQDLAERYNRKSTVERAVNAHAMSLIKRLAREGRIQTTSVDQLVSTPNTDEGTRVVVFEETTDYHVHITLELTATVTVEVEPRNAAAYAIIDEGETAKIYNAKAESESTQSAGTQDTTTLAPPADCCLRYTDCVASASGSEGGKAAAVRIYCCGDYCLGCRYSYIGSCSVYESRYPPACNTSAC